MDTRALGMRRLYALLPLLLLVLAGIGISTAAAIATREPETIADAAVEAPHQVASSSESNMIGVALLQGRTAGDHSGTEIEVFRDGEPLQPMLATSGDGTFSTTLVTGEYRLLARHPGWLPEPSGSL